MVRGYDLYIQHIGKQLDPISNFGKSLHVWCLHLLKTGRFIFICVSSQCHLPHLECLDPFEQSDLDDIEDVIDNELLLLSKPQSGEGEGNLGGWGLWSLLLLLHSQPLEE